MRTNCEQLDDFLDGELAAGAIVAFEEHFRSCASCRRAVAESQAVSGLLQRAFDVEQAASLLPSGEESIEVVQSSSVWPRQSWQLRLRRAGGIAAWAACAAAVLLVFVTALLYVDDNPLEIQRSGQVAQPSTIERPMEKSREQASVHPHIEVQLREHQNLLAVRRPTQNKNVTIVWMYPTVQ
jgi:anti-sigma factor RsiW